MRSVPLWRAAALAATCAIGLSVGPARLEGMGGSRQSGAARDPAKPVATSPAATGVIAGIVTAGDSGRPIRRARVTLEGDRGAPVALTATDDQGRFTLGGLSAGAYTLRVTRSGFLEVVYGQRKPGSGRAGTPIQIAEGQRIDKVTLVMPRGGVLSGVVTDDAGDPAMGVPVRALRSVLRDGAREWQPSATATATSDDRGQFRIFGLVPGDYIVCAAPRDELVQSALQAEALRRRADEMAAASAGRGGQSPETKAMLERMAAVVRPEPPREAYIPVCAPSATDLAGAEPVSLDAGEERAGVGLQLQLLPIARVSGTVRWSGGRLPVGNTASDTSVSLTTPQAIPGMTWYGMHVPANGQFSIPNVPPGTYTLTARALAGQTALWASLDLTVLGQPIADLAIEMQPGMSISGRVVADGAAPVDITKMRLTPLIAGDFAGEIAPVVVSPDADGRFTLEGVVPGRYRIGAYPGSPGATNLRSSVFNGQDTLDFPIEVKGGESISGGVITLVPRMAEVRGELVHESSRPATGYTVIVFTTDQGYWTPLSRRIQGVRPATDGRFSFRNLPPGDYRLVAVTDIEPGQWFDPALLRELLPQAVLLTLAEGERREERLRVVSRE